MQLKDFDYNLDKNLIAVEPKRPRDHSRLLVLDKSSGRLTHTYFYKIVDWLKSGDVLVFNNSKVFPARLIGRKRGTGGKIEIFLLRNLSAWQWQCLVGGPRRRPGLEIEFSLGLKAKIIKDNQDGTWTVKFNKSKTEVIKTVNRIGLTPLPPYIKRPAKAKDKKDYQTVYADDKKLGSVAAPTAGFHFTNRLLKKLKQKGVQFEFITLHVGLGTFAPVKVDDITKHKMHVEWAEVSARTMKNISRAKAEGRRIIAVGTTSVRTLEFIAPHILDPKPEIINHKFQGWVDIFIYPPYKFRITDAMITNFHLPKSTLLMLVAAFAGKDKIDKAYQQAIKLKYRFYSYGDAMLII
jgi:S-adenosylmethionine:tRNA ribosyltransferase-isomerase